MDKYEYKVRADEIKQLIANGEYAEAAEIADTIDWRRVKSVMMLCTVSDLYKINRRYEDARDMLLLAYELRPGGRTICYSLCELSIKMEEFVQAVEYYKEFVQVAPKDSGRYILQYKLYEAQDVSLEERIEVLEELKKRDYREKWAYELAYLYHRVGLATRCVEECDELILWFGAGKYVIKAMELKMLHQPLTEDQQEKYNQWIHGSQESDETDVTDVQEPTPAQVQASNSNRIQSLNDTQVQSLNDTEIQSFNDTQVQKSGHHMAQEAQGRVTETTVPEEKVDESVVDIHVKTMDVGQYNTINLQAELAAGLREVLGEEKQPVKAPGSDTEQVKSEVFFGETEELSDVGSQQEEQPQSTIPFVAPTYAVQPPKELAKVLSQESDGQIRLVMPEREHLEKQITGQMSIEDILAEWERMKKENEEKRREEVRLHVLEQTGSMFTDFEASKRDGLLEKLENDEITMEEAEFEAVRMLAPEDEEETEGEEPQAQEAEEVTEGEEPQATEAEESTGGQEPQAQEAEEGTEGEDPQAQEAEEETEAQEPQATEEAAEATEGEEPQAQEAAEATEGEEPQAQEAAEETEGEELQAQEAEEGTKGEEPQAQEAEEGTEAEEPQAQEAEEGTEGEDPQATEAEEKTEATDDDEVEELEEIEEETIEEAIEDKKPGVEREPAKVRSLTHEEKELYAPYIQSRASKEQLIKAVDSITLAAFTGNVIITGDEGMDTLGLARSIIREIQMADSNFSGKAAKISGTGLNNKDVESTLSSLQNGSLIIEKASECNDKTVAELYKCLQRENFGIIVFLVDSKRGMKRFLANNEKLLPMFPARIDLEALSNDALVAFGKQYAKSLEYSIDELGVLALHTKIEELQTSNHAVTTIEVKEIMDAAIRHVNRKTLPHFFDILFAKRYDEEDMIILSEKDFM